MVSLFAPRHVLSTYHRTFRRYQPCPWCTSCSLFSGNWTSFHFDKWSSLFCQFGTSTCQEHTLCMSVAQSQTGRYQLGIDHSRFGLRLADSDLQSKAASAKVRDVQQWRGALTSIHSSSSIGDHCLACKFLWDSLQEMEGEFSGGKLCFPSGQPIAYRHSNDGRNQIRPGHIGQLPR